MSEPTNLAEEFEQRWVREPPPDLEAFLIGAGAVDAALLCRLARIDQSQRWRRGERRSVEEYFGRFPALHADDESAVDLIYHEYLLHEQLVARPSLDEFASRFPQHAGALAEQVHLHDALAHASEDCGTAVDAGAPAETPWQAGEQRDNSPSAVGARRDSHAIPRSVGRYELLTVVGAGSSGIVYKARDPELDRVVAIKIPRDGHVTRQDDMERFLREARSVAQLRHPSIVSIYEFGASQGLPYLVSEFVAGASLADLLSAKRPPPREAAELVAAVADALHYAHEMGVVHRDVKPANIMLDAQGAPRLMDFGLARREAGDVTMTFEGQVLGTPAYMSPEQARGESRKVDGRSDVYSAGVILYQLLVGELPFRGPTRMLLHQVLHEEPRPPRSVSESVPRDLETICLKAMAKEASRRYATARDLADDLRRFLRDEPIQARPFSAAERAWRWSRRKPALAILTAVVGVLLGAIALGGTAVVSILLAAIAAGGTGAAVLFQRQAKKERLLRTEADENLYYHRIALAHRDLTASLPHVGRAEELLDACPADHRNWEWNYLKRLWRTEPPVLRDPESSEFRGVAFSPDGRRLAAACGDGTIRVWNLETNEVIYLPGHESFVYSVAFSPLDGNCLASSGNDGWVRVWDLRSRREVAPSPLPGLKVYADGMAASVAFSPDGLWLAAASEADAVQVWDAATGQVIHQLKGHEVWASCVAFSRDGRLLATGSWLGVVRIWDARTGRLLHKLHLPEHQHPVGCLSFSPDAAGQYLAAAYFRAQIDVWETTSASIHRRLRGHTGFITGLAFHPADARRLASAGEDRTVRIWDVPSGQGVLQLQGHLDVCSGLAFSPNGRLLATSSYDRSIRIWDASPLAGNQRQQRLALHVAHEVWSVAISPDGTRVAAAGPGPNVQLWNATNGLELQNVHGIFTTVFSLAFGPDGQRLAAAGFDDGAPACVLKILDLQTGNVVLERRERQEIFAVAWSADGRWLALGFRDGSVMLADATTGNVVAQVGKHERGIAMGGLRFRHDGLRLVSASMDGTATIWDLTSLGSAADGEGDRLAPAPTDRLRARISSGNPVIAFWSVGFSPDGSRVITGDKCGRLALWDAETGEAREAIPETPSGGYLSAAYSPDFRWIAAASEDCTARVYDAQTLQLVRRFRGHLGPIHCLAISDKCLVTGGTDRTVRIWDLD